MKIQQNGDKNQDIEDVQTSRKGNDSVINTQRPVVTVSTDHRKISA
jgi:hypothetical protein